MGKSTIRIKIRRKPDFVEVKVLINHPMETGFRYDYGTGERVAEHYIKEVACYYNDELILKSHWGVAVSKDPFFSFRVGGDKAGDVVRVSWKDNKGNEDSFESELEE